MKIFHDQINRMLFLIFQVDQNDVLDLLRNHRRGSTSSSKQHGTTCDKKKQRRSWGPDDTWSRRFTNMRNIVEKEDTKNEKQTKKSSKKHSKKAYIHANTESILKLGECQPLNRYQDRVKPTVTESDSEIWYSRHVCDKKLQQRRKELMKMMSWICDEGYDYIHTEQAKNLTEVELYIDVMLSSSVPALMTFKVNSPIDISVTYQFLPTFKEEYMILNISKTHCMVMRAF